MGNRYRHALEKLAGEPPTSKTALVCSVLPEIELALESGKTRKQVWQRLADEGLDVTYETFHTIIRRARKKWRPAAATGRKMSLRSPGADEIVGESAHDPLANLRKVEESRPGFHFRGTEDLDVLELYTGEIPIEQVRAAYSKAKTGLLENMENGAAA